MEILIQLAEKSTLQETIHLKTYLEKAPARCIESVSIASLPLLDGQMGTGHFLNSLKMSVSVKIGPISDLIKCLHAYVENHRTEITIPTKKGNFVLKYPARLKAQEITNIIEALGKYETLQS